MALIPFLSGGTANPGALLAHVLYHQCHLGSSLTAPDADERLAAGSPCEGSTIDKAQAALLKAIRAQYLSGP